MHYGAMTHDPLLSLVDRYVAHVGREEATVAKWAGSHARLFARLRDGHGCNTKTYASVMDWFAANWPSDLEWPRDVPRPVKASRRKDKAA
jgi:hypothetical protein